LEFSVIGLEVMSPPEAEAKGVQKKKRPFDMIVSSERVRVFVGVF
jgi:hypothetical protein